MKKYDEKHPCYYVPTDMITIEQLNDLRRWNSTIVQTLDHYSGLRNKNKYQQQLESSLFDEMKRVVKFLKKYEI